MENSNFSEILDRMTEKKKIRKTANTVGIPLIISFLLTVFITSVIVFVLRIFTGNSLSIYKFLTDPFFLQFYSIVLSCFIFLIPFTLSIKISKMRISSLVLFEKPKGKANFPLFLLGFSFCIFANIAVSYAGSVFSSFGIEYSLNMNDTPDGFIGFILTLLATACIPGLVEEYVCRGIILGSLRKYGDGFAVVSSAIIFGLLHGNFEQMPFAFLVGLVLGFVYIKTNSIWICVLIHFANNAFSVCLDYLGKVIPSYAESALYTVLLAVILLLGILAVYLLFKNGKDFVFKDFCDKSECKLSKKDTYICFFTSPAVIVFTVACLVEAVSLLF